MTNKYSEYTEEQIILRLLKINNKLDSFVHCMWGFLVGYAASHSDNVDDLLQEYAKDIREYFGTWKQVNLLNKWKVNIW